MLQNNRGMRRGGRTIDEIRLSISWSLWKRGYRCVRVYSVYMSIHLEFSIVIL